MEPCTWTCARCRTGPAAKLYAWHRHRQNPAALDVRITSTDFDSLKMFDQHAIAGLGPRTAPIDGSFDVPLP